MFGSSNRTIIQIQTSKTTQKWVTGHKTKLLLWPFQSSDLNPVENEWGELKRRSTNMELWIWRIWRDSGWRKWSLISYQVFSKLFRHYRRKLRARHELEKAFISQWDFPPTFNCFTSMIGWKFVIFFEWKIKRINNADLFSQPPLLIFTKGANISGGHCIYIYNKIHCAHTVYRHWQM